MSQWFTKTPDQVMSELGADQRRGLTSRQAEERLEKHGPNRLEGAKKESLAKRFLNQMKDPMIIVLLAAAVLSLISSGGEEWIEAVIILVIVIVNAIISISQENSAEKALDMASRKTAAWIFFGGGSCCKVRFLRLGDRGSSEAFSLEFEEISGTSSVFPVYLR